MPTIEPFPGLRYNLARVGSLSDVIAPPYDVVDAKLQQQLYDRSPYNFLRLELTKSEEDDTGADAVYQRASQTFKHWKADDILQREPDPAIYVYHQVFEIDGIEYVRRGFMCRVRLERFGEGKIYPHEQTHQKAKDDRLKLTRATKANLSQIFGLYPDAENEAQELLESAIVNVQGLVAKDHLGVTHKMWPITDVNLIGKVAALVEAAPMFVADGHHRYETACNYRDELAASGGLSDTHPANYVMTMLVSMSDPGMVVLPTHRLLHGIESFSSESLHEKLHSCFEITSFGVGSEAAHALWDHIEQLQDQTTFGLFSKQSNEWLLLRAHDGAESRMQRIASEQSEDWQELGVAMLHRLVFEDLLGLADMPKPTYVHQISEVVDGLDGQLEGNLDYSLAALVMPATIDHIRAISLHKERMPAKSTYFYPKLVSGLVVHELQ